MIALTITVLTMVTIASFILDAGKSAVNEHNNRLDDVYTLYSEVL